MAFRCPKCGNETSQETKYCPNCGCPLGDSNNLLREKIADTKHNELTATLSCGLGIALFLIGFFIQPTSGGLLSTGFFNFFFWISGIFLMVTMAILTTYYSMQRKKLMKELKW
jgi:hypothetical protein